MIRGTEIPRFTFGLALGIFLVIFPVIFLKSHKNATRQSEIELSNTEIWDGSMSNKLFNVVKILCMVMTHPGNHKFQAFHVKETWGKRCNKLLFFSSKTDEVLDIVVLPIEESRDALWNKTKASFKYVHEHFINEFDWFMKADDDNYVIVENLRFLLAHFMPQTSLYFGCRYALPGLEEGYMAGGGYILSRKAVQKFAKIADNETVCSQSGTTEDVEMGNCLKHRAIFVDARDEKQQKRFFPVGVEEHVLERYDPGFWYYKYQYYQVPRNSLNCCSDTSVEYHYIPPIEMYFFDYLTYNVFPFGSENHDHEKMPKKFTIKEILNASDVDSPSQNFMAHADYHELEKDEYF